MICFMEPLSNPTDPFPSLHLPACETTPRRRQMPLGTRERASALLSPIASDIWGQSLSYSDLLDSFAPQRIGTQIISSLSGHVKCLHCFLGLFLDMIG